MTPEGKHHLTILADHSTISTAIQGACQDVSTALLSLKSQISTAIFHETGLNCHHTACVESKRVLTMAKYVEWKPVQSTRREVSAAASVRTEHSCRPVIDDDTPETLNNKNKWN